MAWGRRRKGKQSSGRNTPVSTSDKEETEDSNMENSNENDNNDDDDESNSPTEEQKEDSSPEGAEVDEKDTESAVPAESTTDAEKAPDDTNKAETDKPSEAESKKEEPESKEETKEEDPTMTADSKTREPAQQSRSRGPNSGKHPGNTRPKRTAEKKKVDDPADGLVLTSEKRRGVYECDYCHSDISQLPRIRCAVCPDFDLCLDCFATTDHQAAIARLKAATSAHSELEADGIASTMVPGLSSVAANLPLSKGYKVCDSTRYPIFGSSRFIKPKTTADSNASKEDASTSDGMDADVGDKDIGKAQSQKQDFGVVIDDPKSSWTAEEDLRLIDAIKTHGLGNWADISEAIGGNGSIGKTPKRCMERYFDDFLGRYGHILPQYTLTEDKDDPFENDPAPAATAALMEELEAEDSIRASKRRSAQLNRMPSNLSTSSGPSGRARKRYKVVPTDSLPGYEKVWPKPYVPTPDVKVGEEVARDLSTKNEQAFVKATLAASTKAEADKIREEWLTTKMDQLGAPTVLPPRPEDGGTLPGAELVGFMPRRGEFDMEHENDAEQALADMEFTTADTEQEKELKVKVLQIYYQKQEEREKRKRFILSRNLYDYRQYVKDEHSLPQDIRDLKHRMRLFERFHTPKEHREFLQDILKAKSLRKEIAKLQMYRRIGIRSMAEAEKYELDKSRRQFHKAAQQQKEAEAEERGTVGTTAIALTGDTNANKFSDTKSAVASSSAEVPKTPGPSGLQGLDSLWKQYRPSDRKARRRSGGSEALALAGSSDTAVKIEPEKVDETKSTDAAKIEDSASVNKEGASKAASEEDTKETTNEKPAEPMDIDEAKPSESVADGEQSGAHEAKEEDEKSKTGDFSKVDESLDISKSAGYDLLSRKEKDLCLRLEIAPSDYLQIKTVLIRESLTRGLLDKEGGQRTVIKLDIERRGNVVDFLLKAGWISNRIAKVARTVTPPPVSSE